MNAINSPRARRMPSLRAIDAPPFFGCSCTWANEYSGCDLSHSTVPSLEPSSITSVSMCGYVCALTESRHIEIHCRRLKVGMMTVTSGDCIPNCEHRQVAQSDFA